MQFEKGQSGNPAGRPPGLRNRRTIMAEQLLDGHAETILNKILELAAEGDPAAQRLCMERIAPRLKDRPIAFELPPLETAADAIAAMAEITRGVAVGTLTAGEAAELGKFVQCFATMLSDRELEARIRQLEERSAPKSGQIENGGLTPPARLPQC